MSRLLISLLAAAVVSTGLASPSFAGPLDEPCLASMPIDGPDFIPRDVRLNIFGPTQVSVTACVVGRPKEVTDITFGATIFSKDGRMGPGTNGNSLGHQKPVNGAPHGNPTDPSIVFKGDTGGLLIAPGDQPIMDRVLIRIAWRLPSDPNTVLTASFLAKADVVHVGRDEHHKPHKRRQ